MNDILLTPEEIEKEDWAASDEWEALGKVRKLHGDTDEIHQAFMAFSAAWLCRAQVRKIADWLENNPETDIDAGTLIALRKAAGEGK